MARKSAAQAENDQIKDQAFSELQALIEESEKLLKGTASLVGEEGESLRRQVSLKLKQALDSVSHVRERSKPVVDATEQYIGGHPWQTVAISAGLGLVVGLFDILKGALAVLVAQRLGLTPPLAALCGFAAVVGHNFNAFNGFRGGKGVATSFGMMLLVDPQSSGVAFVVAFTVMYLTRYVSAGSLVGAVTTFAVAALLGRPWWELLIVGVVAAMMFYQHRENIVRLRAGNESRFGQKVTLPAPPAQKIVN